MKFIIIAVSMIIWGLSASAQAAGGYIGAEYTMISSDITDHSGYNLRGGYKFNDFFSVEGKALVSADNDTYSGVTVAVDSLYTVAVKGSLPVTDSLDVYAMYGHSKYEVTASYMGYSESADDDSSSFGFGAAYSHLEAYTVTVEYVEIAEDVNAFNIGFNFNF